MKVREVFEAAREASIAIRTLEEQIELRRQLIGVQGHNSFEVHGKSGVLDPMRHVVEFMDWQTELVDKPDLTIPISEAYEVVAGVERIADSFIVELVMRYYLQGESWREIVDGYRRADGVVPPIAEQDKTLKGLSRSKQIKLLSEELDDAIDRWDKIGIARLKEMGSQ